MSSLKGGVIRKSVRINEDIRSYTIRVIGPKGEQLGILSLKDALKKSEEFDLDLVEVASSATPPVCRIMDFSKYKYEQEKREREAKKHSKAGHIKEVRFRPSIDEHDYQTKIGHAKKFLEKGNKVRVRLFFRGREMAHQEIGKFLMERITKELASVAKIDKPARQINRIIIMVLGPK
ncbi:MAG: translation initiation factor IF-3 [Candidatus Omnitrophica bacterium]|nr:translation initiation factor IF-3 [Candidatus Omnitrophota bacterium]